MQNVNLNETEFQEVVEELRVLSDVSVEGLRKRDDLIKRKRVRINQLQTKIHAQYRAMYDVVMGDGAYNRDAEDGCLRSYDEVKQELSAFTEPMKLKERPNER